MPVYSIIKKSELEGALRLDAEYYQPDYLDIAKKLESIPTETIEEISQSVVNFGAYSLCNFIDWQDEGVSYLNVQNIKDDYIDFDNVKFISEETDKILKKSKVEEGQVLLTMAGTIGNAAVAHKIPEKVNSNQAIAKITLKKDFSPYYLSAFLNSYYGNKQIERVIVSSVQSNIFLGQIKEFKVPLATKKEQQEVEKIYKDGLEELENSKNYYSQAENFLLEELGLKDFEREVAQQSNFAVVNLAQVKKAGRMDAEYFQPKYEKLMAKIKNQKSKTLGDFVKEYSTGYPFKSENYQEQGIPLIRINNIKKGFIDLSDPAYLSENDYLLSKKDIAKPGDIVLSMSGTIGVAAVIPDDIKKCSVNQRILKITPKDIEKDYLTLLLNSIVGVYQLEQIGTGGVQTNISYKDIKNLIVPILPQATQQKIAELVKKSHQARQKAKELLAQAKQKVENLIEQ